MQALAGDRQIAEDVLVERQRQDDKWKGDGQSHPNGTGDPFDGDEARYAEQRTDIAAQEGELTWRLILEEEVAEAFAESDDDALRKELVQVSAVAQAWIKDIDRRKLTSLQFAPQVVEPVLPQRTFTPTWPAGRIGDLGARVVESPYVPEGQVFVMPDWRDIPVLMGDFKGLNFDFIFDDTEDDAFFKRRPPIYQQLVDEMGFDPLPREILPWDFPRTVHFPEIYINDASALIKIMTGV